MLAVLDIKWDKVVTFPTRLCTSFTVLELLMSIIARHLSGFVSIPFLVIIKPRNLPAFTLKAYLFELSRTLVFFSWAKIPS